MTKGQRKPFSSFFTWSNEEQAKFIERETKNVIKRLPRLKSSLKMYGEVSDELYNMSSSELELIGTTYSRAVRSGEISTPSSKRAYQRFINNLRKYSRVSIRELALGTANQRMESWLNTIRANGSSEEIEYAEELVNSMNDSEKIGFTLSKYFIDNEKWNSQETYEQDTEEGIYSIQVLKLELFLISKGHTNTRNLYNKYVATDNELDKVRGGTRKGVKNHNAKK